MQTIYTHSKVHTCQLLEVMEELLYDSLLVQEAPPGSHEVCVATISM